MNSVQQILNTQKSTIDIPAGEYEGPLTINHACTVNGHGATIWTKGENALIVNSTKVTLRNLRIEITNNPKRTVALKIKNDTMLDGIEIYGQDEREGNISNWLLPRMLDFGTFAANKANEFYRKIEVASPCKIINNVHGLEIIPKNLAKGMNVVLFKISSLMDSTILYGDIILETDYGINKRIYITGRAMLGAREIHEQTIANSQFPSENDYSAEKQLNTQNSNGNESSTNVTKGQRLPLDNAQTIFVGFQGENFSTEIDPYAFLLNENRKTCQDSDLVFFGNMQTKENGVYIDSKFGLQGVSVDIDNIPTTVHTIVVFFAVYEDEGTSIPDFSPVRNPTAKLYIDNSAYDFTLELGHEKVVNILEIYKYKGSWRLKLVGAGFTYGLRKICEEYGLNVM